VVDRRLDREKDRPMTTITRTRVNGYVNQVNDQFALAAGLHSIAVYDYSKHRWIEKKPAGSDDSTDSLPRNFVLTSTQVKVRILNGPFAVYTSATGWSEVPAR
jgi:hypothetical protein